MRDFFNLIGWPDNKPLFACNIIMGFGLPVLVVLLIVADGLTK